MRFQSIGKAMVPWHHKSKNNAHVFNKKNWLRLRCSQLVQKMQELGYYIRYFTPMYRATIFLSLVSLLDILYAAVVYPSVKSLPIHQ